MTKQKRSMKTVQLTPCGKQGKRQQIWTQIRVKRQSFTINDLYFALNDISRDAIRAYVSSLVNAEVVMPITNDTPVHYALISDCGVDAPRVRPDGSIVTQGERNMNMWRTMKILKTFNWHDIKVAASTETISITSKTARAYVEMLHRGGYLRQIGLLEPGIKAVYRFVKDTGHQAPIIKRGGVVYDPNLDAIVYQRKLKGGVS